MRFVPLLGYVALSVAVFVRNGVPLADDRVIAWLVGGLLCTCVALRVDRWRRLLVDWLPLAAALTAYDVLRGTFGGHVPIHWRQQPWVDDHVFGVVPTVWLQQRLWDASHLHWWDYATVLTYLSYFLVTPVTLAVLWLRRPEIFRRFVILLVGLWFSALAFFTLTPSTPPWLAGGEGKIGPVTRLVGPVSAHLPFLDPSVLWERGVRLANDLAAFPSLHEAMTILLAVMLWPLAGRRWRVLLVLYPLAMAFSLVYTGEHYVVDLAGGGLLVAAVVAVERFVVRLRSTDGAELAHLGSPGRARALGTDDQPAVCAGAAHDWV
ncbi:MAG: phosphatase PAP2 family protein [Actinomycetota bacterium]